MTDRELWEKFIAENEVMDCDYQAWAFGADADMFGMKLKMNHCRQKVYIMWF